MNFHYPKQQDYSERPNLIDQLLVNQQPQDNKEGDVSKDVGTMT